MAGRTPEGLPAAFIAYAIGFTKDECLTWPYGKSAGYAVKNVGGYRKFLVSRIVCEAINGPPPTEKHQAAHSCGNGHLACVAPKHLRWATHAENMADMRIHGTLQMGEECPSSKLKKQDVLEIRSLAGKITNRAIASKFNISDQQVAKIILRQRWQHIP